MGILGPETQPFGDKKMTENETADTIHGAKSEAKPPEPRTPRSIRFSHSEWVGIETDAKKRGMTAAELVRHAAVSFTAGKLMPNIEALATEIAAQVERIYRGVYLLATLQRDELIREGRQEELERIVEGAKESQASIHKEASGPDV